MSDVVVQPQSGEFERYGLLAAITLVGLSLLLADRMHPAPAPVDVPPADRILRVRLGGNVPTRVVRVAVPVRVPVAAPPSAGTGAPAGPGGVGSARGRGPVTQTGTQTAVPPGSTPGAGQLASANPGNGPAGPAARTVTPVSPPAATSSGARTVRLGEGETLTDIARRELGSARRAAEIAKLNGITDPTRIRAGQMIKLPPR